MDMLKKLLHSALIATLLLSPVANAVSASLMSGDSKLFDSSFLEPISSTSTPHHLHGQSVRSDSILNAQVALEAQETHFKSCCLDCDDECTQACMLCITQASTLSLSHSLNASISFFEFPYSFISITSPDRPPRII